MINLILVLGQSVTTVGAYSTLQECQAQMPQFQRQNIVVACVQQPSPEDTARQAQSVLKLFQQFTSEMK